MGKVTSKLQLTVPKAIAEQYDIRPGDELQWTPAGDGIRIDVARDGAGEAPGLSIEEKLELFDRGSERLRKIQGQPSKKKDQDKRREDRGWTREDLYVRGRPR